jgi:hypothetical protein
VSRIKEWLRPFLNLRVLWDVFMVWAALINLGLILFDVTYLWMRPLYFRYATPVVRVYDVVLGIEPHPLTSRFLEEVDATRALLNADPHSPELEEHVTELRTLSLRILRENPFERTGQEHSLDLIRQAIARNTGRAPSDLEDDLLLPQIVDDLWPVDPTDLRFRLERQIPPLRFAFETNYYREYDRSGRLMDHFWILDLPFLILFWLEFLVRWGLALRHDTYARWFFFPIFNWYDVLGLVPLAYFRPFRLLRAVSMYMRLRRSELSGVGRDAISRTAEYFSNIITEEVSDRVFLRILAEFHEEISAGTHSRITRATVEPRRREIERVVAGQIRQLLTDEATIERFRGLLRLHFENSVAHARALSSIPLPDAVLRPIVRHAGEAILDAGVETMVATLDSDEGRRAVEDLASAVLDDLFYGPGLVEVETVAREIALHVIEHMQEVVRVKKWAQPDASGP